MQIIMPLENVHLFSNSIWFKVLHVCVGLLVTTDHAPLCPAQIARDSAPCEPLFVDHQLEGSTKLFHNI